MKLAATHYGPSSEIVDLDRNGGPAEDPRPLIVARVYDDDAKRLVLAAPEMRDLCREALMEAEVLMRRGDSLRSQSFIDRLRTVLEATK